MEKEKYISLILEKLNGVIQPKDEKILDDWLLQSDENISLFKEIENVWEKTKDFNPDIVFNENDSWQKIQAKISETKTVQMPVKKSQYLKIASVVIILLSMGIVWNTVFNKDLLIKETTFANETKHIILPDGSSVDLNENSQLIYTSNFEERNVELEGEAFFKVTKNTESPFKVLANETQTIVLGTSFNLNTNRSSVNLALFTGKVKFITKTESDILIPGEKTVYNVKSNKILKEQTDIQNDIAWKTKKLVFENTNLLEFVKAVEDYFKISIDVKAFDTSCTFTGTFEDAELTEVLEAISYTYETSYKYIDYTYYFEEIKCEQ